MENPLWKQSSQEPRDLLGSVFAHEIANSLHGISTVATCMERHFDNIGRLDPLTGESLRLVTREIHRLNLLIEDFRSSQLFRLDLRPTALPPLVEDCLALQSAKAAQRRIRIECRVPSDLPLVMADAAKLKQVFLDLYTDALDAMPNGGILTVSAREREESVCLDIADSGERIPEDLSIFEPSVTHKPRGTGLGLAVVKWIVQAHGGTISYTSKPGEGTVFLPCLAYQPPSLTKGRGEAGPGAASSSSNCRML